MRQGNHILDHILEKHFVKLIVTATLLATLVIIFWALPSSPGDASGWWQVAIAIVGLPILIYQLYQIRKALEQKPEISIGIVPGKPTVPQVKRGEVLPRTLISLSRCDEGKSDFSLVVQNHGKLPARYVTIRLEYTPLEDDSPKAQVRPPSGFKNEGGGNFVFIGGEDRVLYPNSPDVFTFSIGRPSPVSGLLLLLRDLKLGDHCLHCTVWAERLDKPMERDLIIRIAE